MAENSRAINRVFTHGVISDLINTGNNDVFDYVVKRYVNDPNNKTHGELFSEIYSHLEKEKRNEYYYLNTLLNRILVGIHSVNTTTALSQIRIGKHIADFIMINGDGKVYEIKSDLDDFDRLHDQLMDYYKAFSMVSVLSTLQEYEKISLLLSKMGVMGESVGVYMLNDSDAFFNRNYRKEPLIFNDLLNHNCMFKLMRKCEYENVINKYYKKLPQVKPVFHFRICFEWFMDIPVLEAQKMVMNELRKRNKIEKSVFESIQSEVKSVVYFSNLKNNIQLLRKLLKSKYRG